VFLKPTEREHFKKLLSLEEKRNPNLFKNILSAIKPLLDEINLKE